MASSMTLIIEAIQPRPQARPGPSYSTTEEILKEYNERYPHAPMTIHSMRYRLAKAEQEGAIVKVRQGKQVYYSPAYDSLEDALENEPALQAEHAGNPYMEL